MTDIRSKTAEIYGLEQLAAGHSPIHALHPMAKLVATLVYIVCVASFDRLALASLAPFVFYPVIIMALAEIPYGPVLRRTMIALPFSLFAGLYNASLISLLTIVLRTLLCVSAVLIMVAVTPLAALAAQLRRLHVPAVLATLLEMTYRYIGTLMDEAATMLTACQLRSKRCKGVQIEHMGSLAGLLLIRSSDRAERVYQAMKCRGYPGWEHDTGRRPLKAIDYRFLILVCGLSIFLRLSDVSKLLADWLEVFL